MYLVFFALFFYLFTPAHAAAEDSSNKKTLIRKDTLINEKDENGKIIKKYRTEIYKENNSDIPKWNKELSFVDDDASSLSYQRYETIVIVTPKRTKSPLKKTAENVIVYTQEDIKRIPGRDLAEVLSQLPGVFVDARNQFGQASSFSINGSDSNEVLLLVDGIPFNTQLSGQANPAVIPIENVERIEIIKGASSSVWGSSLGGVVNIITKENLKDGIDGRLTTSYGEFATTKQSLEISLREGDLEIYGLGSFLNTSGIRSDSDVEESKFFGKVNYQLTDEFGVNASLGYSGADVSDGVKRDGNTVLQPYYLQYGQIQFDLDKDDSQYQLSAKFNRQDIKTETVGSTVTNSKSNYRGLSFIGSHLFREQDQLVYGVDVDFNLVKQNRNIATPKHSVQFSPYANYTYRYERLTLVPGFRYDDNNRFGNQFSPALGLIYDLELSRPVSLRAKVSRAFKAPHLLLIYAESLPFVVPNESLKPERAIIYEMGFNSSIFDNLSLSANFYWAEIEDAIKVIDIGTFEFQPNNIEEFRRRSVDARLDYRFNDKLKTYFTANFNYEENLITDEEVRGSSVPKWSYHLGFEYLFDETLSINLFGFYNRSNNLPSVSPNDRKFIFNAKILKTFKDVYSDVDIDWFLNIYNIGDSDYWINQNFPSPTRYFESGLAFDF